MNSVGKAKERLRKYPMLIAQCRDSAGEYAKCVALKANIGKDDCHKEFIKFKACLIDAAKSNKTKL